MSSLLSFFTIIQGKRPGDHPPVVWEGKDALWGRGLSAARRRIFVRLEEGGGKAADKSGGKIRIARHLKKAFQESEAGCLHGGEDAQPLFFLGEEQFQPAVKLFPGNGKAFAEVFHGRKVQEILSQSPQDEEKTIGRIRDDEVREDGMGMAAGTDKAEDAEAVADRSAMNEIEQGAVIVGMDRTGAFCSAAGTGLEFRPESGHKGIK